MKTLTRIAVCLAFLTALATPSFAQEKVPTEITILVPEKGMEETKVKVNGKELDGEGGTRVYKINLEKDKEYKFDIEAFIVPNNYTEITRKKQLILVGAKNTNVKVNMTQAQAFIESTTPDLIKVRYVPTPDDIVDEMCKLAKVGKNDVVWDLGCGDCRMLIRPIQKFGAKKGVGIEFDPKVLKEHSIPTVKKAKLENKIDVREGDMLKLTAKDLEDATVVMLYIGDDLGERVGPVLKSSLKPGSRIVSHRFILGDWKADKSITVKGEDGGEYELHLWIVPERKIDKKKKQG
jgi:uncharacterized protein (TIGR03000 family)